MVDDSGRLVRSRGWNAPLHRQRRIPGNGSYDPTTGRVTQTVTPAADIGTVAAPVEFVLDPHWKMLQFQFFDRYYGNAALNSPPVTGHGRRIATPPLWLEGFRTDPNAAGASADTISNWTIGADPKDGQQCLPWILSKTNTGAALPTLTGATMGLRFRTHQALHSFIYSSSDTVREIQHLVTSPPGPLAPGPDRLRYYDLPRIWKSKKYYTRNLTGSPPADAKFFQNMTAADLAQADFKALDTSVPRQLIFSLDDIILTKANLVQLPIGATQRVTLFHHKFANRSPNMPPGTTWPNLSNEGVHKPGASVSTQGYPYSNITLTVLYYITDYADWTRLVLAQGNLFDAFAERTPDVPANDVVGARAAVRWVDATTPPNGGPPVSAVLGTAGTVSPRPGLTQRPFFAIQPYFEKRYLITYNGTNPQATAIYQNEWTTPYAAAGPMTIGRFDIAHLRCCDWDGGNEVSVVFRYLRFNVDFNTASNDNANPPVAQPNPLAALGAPARQAWVQGMADNCMARWNGNDAFNTARVWVLPQPTSPPGPPLKTQIVTIFHYLQVNWAHFNIRSCAPTIPPVSMTSFMEAVAGDGQIRVNATVHDGTAVGNDAWGAAHVNRGLPAAHELGHGLSLPDEYENNGTDSPMYTALNVLGSPYQFESRARGLMFRNWFIRARYLWYVAEWMRTITSLSGVAFKLLHNDTGPPGAPLEVNYFVPHYPHAAFSARDFVYRPVTFNLRRRTAPNTSCFDSVLYCLGDDKYSSVVLPGLSGGGARIDGLLVVLLRMQVDFSAVGGNAAFKTGVQAQFFNSATNAIEPQLNFTRFAQFQIGAANTTPSFNKCLLHFTACYSTQGVPGHTSAGALDTGAPHHLRIVLARAAVANPTLNTWTQNAPPAANILRIDVPNDFNTNAGALGGYINACAALTFQYACITLGLNSAAPPAAGSFQTPASYIPIVQTVMDATAPAPAVT